MAGTRECLHLKSAGPAKHFVRMPALLMLFIGNVLTMPSRGGERQRKKQTELELKKFFRSRRCPNPSRFGVVYVHLAGSLLIRVWENECVCAWERKRGTLQFGVRREEMHLRMGKGPNGR
jgi:hypothetical protein